MASGVLLSINTSNGGVPKHPRHEARITDAGVEGDRQRDLRHHGGPDRAVCLYSFDRIRELQAEGHPVSVGLLGENLTIQGIDWRTLTPGTRVRIGEVQLQLTSFAVPCRNLAVCFENAQVSRVSQKAHPGWSRAYARVEQTGTVRIGDTVEVVDDHAPPAAGAEPGTGVTVHRSGSLVVPASRELAFQLFTPDGERLWVPDFDPDYLHPLSGEQVAGAIFVTRHNQEQTLWMVLRLSPGEGILEYARVTPGSRRGTVRVTLEALDRSSTRATITYDLTSTSARGNATLAQMTEATFADTLRDWERWIEAAVHRDSFE